LSGCSSSTYTPPPTPTPTPGPDRLSASGTVAAYTGTISQSETNDVIASNPVTMNQAGTANVTVTVGSDASGNTTYTSDEKDAFSLQTLSSTTKATVAFQPASNGQTDVRTLSTTETDSTGAVFSVVYGPNNGLQTVIPEQSGTFTNDASATYTEVDPGVTVGANGSTVTTKRVIAADGSYTESETITLAGVTNENFMAPDFSAREEELAFGGGYEFSAPSNGTITYGFYDSVSPGSPTLGKAEFTAPIPDWIPASQTKPTIETDTIAANATLDARCPSAGATFHGSPNLVKQVVTAVDSALGTVETRTTQSFDVAGAGSVCVTVDDKISSYYDYTGQEGPFLLVTPGSASTVLTSMTMSEAIALKSLNGQTTLSAARAGASVTAAAPMIVPRSVLVAGIQHRVHQALLRRLNAARRATGAVK